MFRVPEPPQFKTQQPPPPPPPKRKRTPTEVADQTTPTKNPKGRKKRVNKKGNVADHDGGVGTTGEEALAEVGLDEVEGDGKKKRRVTKSKKEEEVVSTLNMNAMTFGATKRQRQWVRKAMLEGLAKSVASYKEAHEAKVDEIDQELLPVTDAKEAALVTDEDVLMDYVNTVEQQAYDGIFGRDMHVVFNMYRNEFYRQHCFGIIHALRGCGALLMSRYAPDVLACLPQELLVKGTPLGAEVDAWRARVEFLEQRERELREAARAVKGEGWLRCPKCGGQFDTSLLQMRGADEPATLFMTCANCNFTKRKG